MDPCFSQPPKYSWCLSKGSPLPLPHWMGFYDPATPGCAGFPNRKSCWLEVRRAWRKGSFGHTKADLGGLSANPAQIPSPGPECKWGASCACLLSILFKMFVSHFPIPKDPQNSLQTILKNKNWLKLINRAEESLKKQDYSRPRLPAAHLSKASLSAANEVKDRSRVPVF